MNSPETSAVAAAADAANPARGAPGSGTEAPTAAAAAPSAPAPSSSRGLWQWLSLAALAVALGALGLAYSTSQQQRGNDAEFAKRQQASADQAAEARLLARQAEAAARDAAARVALLEARLAEVSLQRTQLEELIQSLSRSRDENLLADLEAALRVAMQQVAITTSTEPLLAALKQADERLARLPQPRLERVRRAVLADLERVKSSASVDVPTLGLRIDELVRQVDELPMLAQAAAAGKAADLKAEGKANGGSNAGAAGAAKAPAAAASAATGIARWVPAWLGEGGRAMWAHGVEEVRGLVRVTRVANPEAALAAPEQAFFVRENLKLRLLNARLSTLSRQFDAAQSDLREAETLLLRYFDRNSRRVDAALVGLRQLASQARAVTLPRPDATLAALAAAGR